MGVTWLLYHNVIYPPGSNAHLNLNAISWPLELHLIRVVNHGRQCTFDFNGRRVLAGADFAECGVAANYHHHQLRPCHYLGNVFKVSSTARAAVAVWSEFTEVSVMRLIPLQLRGVNLPQG